VPAALSAPAAGRAPHTPDGIAIKRGGGLIADLLVRNVEDGIVQALKKLAGAHGRSAEAEHRAILAAALLTPPRRNLAELLAALPDVGLDADFEQQQDGPAAADVFG
jgi:plasmid stability protein